VAEVDMLIVVEVERASAATGSLAHSIVTAGRDGVATGTILAGDVMLDCARADDAMASTVMIVCAEGYMLMQVVLRDWISSAKRCGSQFKVFVEYKECNRRVRLEFLYGQRNRMRAKVCNRVKRDIERTYTRSKAHQKDMFHFFSCPPQHLVRKLCVPSTNEEAVSLVLYEKTAVPCRNGMSPSEQHKI
jgi:hypothetical protein